MARILWLSDAPSHPTGFGLVTNEICTRLAARGHILRILGWWAPPTSRPGLEGEACAVTPEGASAAIEQALRSFQPDVLVSLADLPWVSYLSRPPMRDRLDAAGVPWCAYYPLDGARPDGRMPPAWADILHQADLPVAMSRFGQTVSAASGLAAAYLPHGVDTSLFAPPPDRAAAKAALGLEGRFVILSDMRNHRRKMLPRLLDILRDVAAARPAAVLLLNTNLEIDDDRDSHRYDLRADIAALGLEQKVRLTKPGADLGMAELARLYAASDVHLLTSYGEGFGLPTLQAAASGVVPLAGDHSANRELLAGHGIALPAAGWAVDEFGLHRPFIDRAHAVTELLALHDDPGLLASRARAGRGFARAFDWDALTDRWESLLACAALRTDRPLPPPLPPDSIRRPTGHTASMLPPPRFGLPLRDDALVFLSAPRVLAEAECLSALRQLPAIFPGLVLERLTPQPDLSGVILIIDPHGRAPAGRGGIPRIGPGAPADPAALLALARQRLTDPVSRRP